MKRLRLPAIQDARREERILSHGLRTIFLPRE
jgi:hypothetical protein